MSQTATARGAVRPEARTVAAIDRFARRAMLGQLGLSPSRLRFEYIGAPMQAKLMDILKQMDDKLRPLGPNPAARPASISGLGR